MCLAACPPSRMTPVPDVFVLTCVTGVGGMQSECSVKALMHVACSGEMLSQCSVRALMLWIDHLAVPGGCI